MFSTPVIVCLACVTALWLLVRKPTKVKVLTVIDGDTLMSVDTKGVLRKLRLVGVDAPEKGQRLGAESAAFLRHELLGRWSKVRWYGQDRYRRHLVRLQGQTGDVSAGLLRKGLAFPDHSLRSRLHSILARATFRGVWLTGTKPHTSWKRKYRLWGWASWKLDTRKRKKRSRKNARPR